MTTYIIGHQKPDTDSVVAALAFKHIFDQEKCWGHQNSVPCITHAINIETKFVLNKFKTQAPQLIKASDIQPKDKIVLVDHNEQSQRLENLKPEQITDIFDHHKINLNLSTPIYITTKSWGSTCTIAWWLIDLFKYPIPKELAGLMLAAIISDTTGFKSSTTTVVDKKAAEKLAKIAGVNIEELTFELLKAKSDISSLSDDQIVAKDYKVFDFSGKKVFINQLETVEQEKVIKTKKTDLLQALTDLKQKENYDLAFMAISDILKINTKLLLLSENEQKVAEIAFNGKAKDNLLDIGPKLSRKKDIAPKIEKAVK
ncbi:manganese-dependent inorganic pyrophosphatase [Patescibacteria group bacterium]